ncbi:MAG: hypothetical protein ACKV22_17195 [Bryobacteraceae bacterium]
MALIEYMITVDANGNASVVQDVKEIGPGDKIRFVANNSNTAILFDAASPFDSPGPGVSFPVQKKNLQNPPAALPVTKSIDQAPKRFVPEFQAERRTFHFQCGQLVNGGFSPWGGGGGNTSSGGSDGN